MVSALIAKIHTVEWTTCVLRHPALQIGMNANWYGALGETFKDRVGRVGDSEALSGVIGSSIQHHSAPFSLTEEFVSVYRMHPLIPDDWNFFSLETGEHLQKRMEMGDMWYSFGLAGAGAVCLHNYPNALRKLTRVDGQITDLATLDIVRDRERGVPRYNDFREALRMPRRKSIDDIAPNTEWAAEINEVYNGDVDAVDLQIGMQAEQPPKGFGFSDTAFRIFILMASRRLKSDRFFTNDFRPEVYTQIGYDWVNNTWMRDVLLRHYPELAPVIGDVERVFARWPKLGAAVEGKKHRVMRLADSVRAYMPWGAWPVAAEFKRASALEGLRFTTQIAVPNVFLGLFNKRELPSRIASRVGAEYLGYRLVDGMVRNYGPGPLYIRVALEEALLVHHPDDLQFMLGGSPDPFASDPDAKRKGMAAFQPDALTISRGQQWKERRKFADAVLDTGKPMHRLAQPFTDVAADTARELASDTMRWQTVNTAMQRMARRVVFGAAAARRRRSERTAGRADVGG